MSNENKTILLVEDNEHLNKINSRALHMAGYRVLTALNLREARAHLSAAEPDAIVLDILLPDGNGVDFCREIRERTAAPILFLTSVAGVEQALEGLRAGGDDYLNKPFHIELLLERIRAFWRRDEIKTRVQSGNKLTRGPLELNVTAGQAFLHGRDMLLTQKEFALLLLLVQNEGKTLTRQYLYEKVWNRPVHDDAKPVWVQMSRLRKKLAPAEEDGLSLTMSRGEGYCFTCHGN